MITSKGVKFQPIFLNFEKVKITTKFINKCHYEMRFLKKNNLYQLISVVLCTSLGYLQTPISPQLLISNNNTELFYSFEENMLSLYNIKKPQTYNKIWEYSFMENKNSELSSILFEDITGNGKKELVVILYAFGSQGEIYLFSTDNAIPNGKPDIYAFPILKAGMMRLTITTLTKRGWRIISATTLTLTIMDT